MSTISTRRCVSWLKGPRTSSRFPLSLCASYSLNGMPSSPSGIMKEVSARASTASRTRCSRSAMGRGPSGTGCEHGCPDCGVHHACGEIVTERDRLRAAVARYKEFAESEILDRVSAELGVDLRRQLDGSTKATDG
jgi:hypothetical protein